MSLNKILQLPAYSDFSHKTLSVSWSHLIEVNEKMPVEAT